MSKLVVLSVCKKKNLYEVVFSSGDTRLYLEDTILFYNLYKLKELDVMLEEMDYKNLVLEAFNKSLTYISKYNVSTPRLKRYLKEKEYDNDIIDEVIFLIKDKKIIDDNYYAKLSCDNLIKKGFSINYIKYELSKLQTDLSFVNEICEEVIINSVLQVVKSRLKNYMKYEQNIRNEKIIKFIMSKGHSYDFSKKIIRLLGDQYD